MNTKILNNLIEESDLEFGTNHVSLNYDTDNGYLTAHYNSVDDELTDIECYSGDDKKDLTDDQITIIYDYLAKKLKGEQEKDSELKQNSMDDLHDDNGVSPMMFR